MANYKIFNLPFKLNLSHDKEGQFFLFNLESKSIRLKIKNFFQYLNKNLNGNLEAQIINDINNGLIFQSQVSYLIPIFGTILSYIFLKELITTKVLISLIAVCVGIYFVRKAYNKKLFK